MTACFAQLVERQFEIIGEALNKVGAVEASLAAQIPEFHRIIGLRHRLIHGYDNVEHIRPIWPPPVFFNHAGYFRAGGGSPPPQLLAHVGRYSQTQLFGQLALREFDWLLFPLVLALLA